MKQIYIWMERYINRITDIGPHWIYLCSAVCSSLIATDGWEAYGILIDLFIIQSTQNSELLGEDMVPSRLFEDVTFLTFLQYDGTPRHYGLIVRGYWCRASTVVEIIY